MKNNSGWRRRLGMASGGVFFAVAGIVGAAPLDLDPGYGVQGQSTFNTGQPQAQIERSVLQADGKLIVAGYRTTQVGDLTGTELFARRFNVDGFPDLGFGTLGESRFSVRGADVINMITLQADGKIVLAVSALEPCTPVPFFVCINSAGQETGPTSAVVRLRTNGTLDTTLGGKGFVEANDFYGGYAVAVQPDGKLLLAGSASISRARIFIRKLARFNADGTRDPGFNGGQSVVARCAAEGYSLLVQPDGGIVVGGDDGLGYTDSAMNPGLCIERLFPDGSHDLAFNNGQLWTNCGINVSLASLALMPDGKLLAVGRGTRSTNTATQDIQESGVIAARFAANGVLDLGYGNGGTLFAPVATSSFSTAAGSISYTPGSSIYYFVDFTFTRDSGFVAAGYDTPVFVGSSGPYQNRNLLLKVTERGHADMGFGVDGIARGTLSLNRLAGFLRDIEDRWFLVSLTKLPDLNAGGLIERYQGERPDSVPVIEFYNVNLDHYFITANDAEAAGIDAGAAGPGWQRTGENFRAWQPTGAGSLNGAPQLGTALCRFYGTPGRGPNSHFYTIDMPECNAVRQDPGWTFEGTAFYAFAPLATPAGNACPGWLSPVYRVYNNRFAQNDSNHRYTTSVAIYQQMQQRGWMGEGVVYCAAAQAPPASATIMGFHGGSDPVKTLGWACSTTDAAPVRVHLYAEVDGTLRLLDTQLADKRRDDIAAVCGGPGHAFRFSDYARTPDGIALYGKAGPVRMHVYAETSRGLQLLNASPRSVSFTPVGLWDPGLRDGRWRTDLDNPLEGTNAAPLLLGDCQFQTPVSDGYPSFSGGGPDPVTHCRYGSTISPVSNAASSSATWPLRSFWAVVGNVEAAFDNPLCVNGPPGQSLPFDRPGSGAVFGLIALPDDEAGVPARRKMHLVLNSWNMAACRNQSYGVPYLSFGAQADRGNNGVITYLNLAGANSRLQFGLTLMDTADASPDAFGKVPDGVQRYSQAHVLIEALWGGRKRTLFIELVPDARRDLNSPVGGIDLHIRFNWHMVNSFLYPGTDYVYKSAAVLTAQCRKEGIDIATLSRALTYSNPATRGQARHEYAIDLQGVFDCLNRTGAWGAEAMPAHAIPVTAIHFGIEQNDRLYRNDLFTGESLPNALWIAVDSVEVN